MDKHEHHGERRRFTRIPFADKVCLRGAQGIWYGELVDISLKGLLVQVPSDWSGKVDDRFSVELRLGEGDEVTIKTESRVVHRHDQRVGFAWERIDLDSFIHLKRLLQLHLEDEAELMRELHALGQPRHARSA
jgi:hypothetical protein